MKTETSEILERELSLGYWQGQGSTKGKAMKRNSERMTDEQFWKLCGATYGHHAKDGKINAYWQMPDGALLDMLPPVDMNSLWKWGMDAVKTKMKYTPPIRFHDSFVGNTIDFRACEITSWYVGEGATDELALQAAIIKVLEG